MNKKLKKWLQVLYFFICKFVFLWYCFLINIYKPPFSYCFMKCEVSQTNYVEKKAWNFRFSRFYDIKHETVVTPTTDFGILNKNLPRSPLNGYKADSHYSCNKCNLVLLINDINSTQWMYLFNTTWFIHRSCMIQE